MALQALLLLGSLRGASIANDFLDSAFKHAGITVNRYGIDDDNIHMMLDESGF